MSYASGRVHQNQTSDPRSVGSSDKFEPLEEREPGVPFGVRACCVMACTFAGREKFGRISTVFTAARVVSEDCEEECLVTVPHWESVMSDLFACSREGRLVHANQDIFVDFVVAIFGCISSARRHEIDGMVGPV